MKKTWYVILIFALTAWACSDKDVELQSAPSSIFQLWVPISCTPLEYAPDSSWQKTAIIYIPFEQSDKAHKCGAIEFFSNGKLDLYDCGFCGTPPLVETVEQQRWQDQQGEIVFRGQPQWIGGDYESRIVSANAQQLRVIQERR